MSRLLLLFIDGVGLGEDDPTRNPLVAARTPTLDDLLEGQHLILSTAPLVGKKATLLAVDACLGVAGNPQSASGQAALLTGHNVPAETGGHYGPKPTPQIAAMLRQDNIFMQVTRAGRTAALLNAYPPRYFEAIDRGRRLYSAIPLAAAAAGVPLLTAQDLQAGDALSADFTAAGWVAQPGFPPAPVLTPPEAGHQLAILSSNHDLTWFDYWLSDYAGHRAALDEAVGLVETFDAVLGSLVRAWQDRQDLIVITSDHGNLEDIEARGHTRRPVPALLIGPLRLRRDFADGLHDLTDFCPAILRTILGRPS
jgi:2,3-bisphosphoglycerate-independent phosphoglycerate mutase